MAVAAAWLMHDNMIRVNFCKSKAKKYICENVCNARSAWTRSADGGFMLHAWPDPIAQCISMHIVYVRMDNSFHNASHYV